jgi:hypothetical protein
MTSWSEPERPVLRARPPKEFRDPKAPRHRFDPDDRWVLGGLTVAAALVVGYIGYWTNWFGLTAPPSPPPDASGAPTGAATGTTTGGLVVLALFALFVVGVVVWILWALRDPRPRLDQLPEAEQARRRQAAALLREVEPPVSDEAAAAQLRPDWLEEAARQAAERSRGASGAG